MVPDAIDLTQVHRALVIKLRHHGDVLLTSPVFQVLKNHAPHIEIDALVYHDTREMLTGHPAIANVFTIDREWKHMGPLTQATHEMGLYRLLRARKYDLVIHLTEHPRGAWLTRLLHPKYSVAQRAQGINEGRDSRWWKNSFTHTFPSPRATFRHTVESNLDALRRLGIYPSPAEKRLVLIPGEAAETKGCVADGAAQYHRRAFHSYPSDVALVFQNLAGRKVRATDSRIGPKWRAGGVDRCTRTQRARDYRRDQNTAQGARR